MSECPYKNFRSKIHDFIKILSTPRSEYSGMAPCPFVAAEFSQDKLMIELFDPTKNSIIDMVEKLNCSKYESALFVQITDKDVPAEMTFEYQSFINKLLKNSNYDQYKCICMNPKDDVNILGFNVRKHSPYFLINIVDKKLLSETHKKILKTKYFDKMDKKYLDYLHVTEDQIGRKNE